MKSGSGCYGLYKLFFHDLDFVYVVKTFVIFNEKP